MAKIIDITDKLSFDENPRLTIKEKEYEVNADAETMLEILGAFNTMTEVEAMKFSYEKLFSEKDRKALNKLPFKDLTIVVQTAMTLVQGESEGE